MSLSSFPFDGQTTTETQYSKLFRELQSTGVVGSQGDSTLKVTVDASNPLQLKIAYGSAYIRGHMALSTDTSSELVSVPAVANNSGGQRMDLVVLRLDPSSNTITPMLLQGSSTAAPTPTQTDTGIYDLVLAKSVLVGAGAGSFTLTDLRTFVDAGGVGCWTSAARPGSPRKSRLGLNVTLGQYEYWNGTAWTLLLPADTGWVGVPLLGAANASGSSNFLEMRRVGSQVFLRARIIFPDVIDTSPVKIADIPAGMAPSAHVRLPIAGYASSTANGSVFEVQYNATDLMVYRVGPTNGNLFINQSAWLVD